MKLATTAYINNNFLDFEVRCTDNSESVGQFEFTSFYRICVTALEMKYHHFPTCYAYSVKKPIGELNLERALNEDTGPGVFSFFFSSLSSSSPLGQTAVSGNSTLHQCMHDWGMIRLPEKKAMCIIKLSLNLIHKNVFYGSHVFIAILVRPVN